MTRAQHYEAWVKQLDHDPTPEEIEEWEKGHDEWLEDLKKYG